MKNPFKKKVKKQEPVATELVKTEEKECCICGVGVPCDNCEFCGEEVPKPVDACKDDCHGECVACDELLKENPNESIQLSEYPNWSFTDHPDDADRLLAARKSEFFKHNLAGCSFDVLKMYEEWFNAETQEPFTKKYSPIFGNYLTYIIDLFCSFKNGLDMTLPDLDLGEYKEAENENIPDEDCIDDLGDDYSPTNENKEAHDFKTEYPKAETKPTSDSVESIKHYEKIITQKFTEKIQTKFDYIFSVSEVKKIQNSLKQNKQKLQSYKELILETSAEIDKLSKIYAKVNFHEELSEVSSMYMTTIDIETSEPNIKKVPNHQDDLILLCTIGLDSKGLTDRINGLKGKLSQLETSLGDTKRYIYSDEELLLDGINDVGLELINMDCDCCKDLNFAIHYNGWTVNGVVYRNDGAIEYTRVDFVAEEDDFDSRTAFEILVYTYQNDRETKQLAEQQIHDNIDQEEDTCVGDGDCENCGECY